jgi:hypothetical protein
VSIQRYMMTLCALDELGQHDVAVKCGAQAFRADTIRTNVTAPGQAFIQQIKMCGHPQLTNDEVDAWPFSLAAEEAMRAEWFRERGITEAEWLAKAEAESAVLEDQMRREEAGEKVDDDAEEDEYGEYDEDGPPDAPRLAFMTVTQGQEVRLHVRYVSKVPKGKLVVMLFGAADMGARDLAEVGKNQEGQKIGCREGQEMNTPYRRPDERSGWEPRAGERIVILSSEWSETYGHVGKKGHVVTSHGWRYEVYVGGGRGMSLHVYPTEIAPAEEITR